MELIYTNDSGEGLSCWMLFTDECLLYQVISSEEDCNKLQHDLESIYIKLVHIWQMRFNLSKYVILVSPILTDCFIDDHNKLENMKQHSYLRITINQSLCHSFLTSI